jgi:predicted nucleic acid-binding protein
MIILDTNVVSELMKPTPADRVIRFVASQAATSLYTTSITYAEILHGILLLPAGKRRKNFEQAAEMMFDEDFAGRILPFGNDGAYFYAEVATERQRRGRPISQFDAQIAAIARATGAGLATRNVSDFDHCGIDVVDPWT